MKRLEAVAAWFFTCLGITLLGCSILVVPEKAFADHWTKDCQEACCYSCYPNEECGYSNECYMSCMSACSECASACNENQSCIDECVQKGKEKCLLLKCEIDQKCLKQGGNCDKSNQYCNKLGAADCGACICIYYKTDCNCRNKYE